MEVAYIEETRMSDKIKDSTENKLQALVRMIQERKDQTGIKEVLDELEGQSISTPEVRGTLPKRWQKIVKSCLTTPLRSAITWRRLDIINLILRSSCKIEERDLSLALQKILRHVETEDDIQIVVMLLKAGVEMSSLYHLQKALNDLIKARDLLDYKFIDSWIQNGNNTQKGYLLEAMFAEVRYVNSKPPILEVRNINFDDRTGEWNIFFFKHFLYKIFLSGFNPYEYMNKKHLGNTPALQACSIVMIPVLLRMSTQVDSKVLGTLMRYMHLNKPVVHVGDDTYAVLKRFSKYCVALGYNMKDMNAEASFSQQLAKTYGFEQAEDQPRLLTLKEYSRITIRDSICAPNVLIAMRNLCNYPPILKNYVLMSEYYPDMIETLHIS